MPRRILFLITDLEIGGTPTVVRELALRLNDPPHVVVEVACLKGWGPVADQLRDSGILVTAFDARRASDLPFAAWRLCRLIRERRFDTVFSFLIHANAAAALVAPFCPGVRFLQSIQTTQPEPRWHWRVQRLVQGMADRVVVPSASAARIARAWAGIANERIATIPNAVDASEFDATYSVNLQRVPEKPFQVGFIGRLDPVKRVPDLIAVAASVADLHIHIFGDGADRPRIEAAIAERHVEKLITLHGAIRRPQEALAMLDVLVLPSAAEGFGLVLIEAMAAGVPVVATNVDGIRDVIDNQRTGILVPVGNVSALCEAIVKSCESSQWRNRIIAAARAEVERRFGWTTVLRAYREVLQLCEFGMQVDPVTEFPELNL